jgi:hypothetical protein
MKGDVELRPDQWIDQSGGDRAGGVRKMVVQNDDLVSALQEHVRQYGTS